LLIPIKTLLALLQAKFADCVKGLYTFSITPPSWWYQSLSVSTCCVCIEAQVPVVACNKNLTELQVLDAWMENVNEPHLLNFSGALTSSQTVCILARSLNHATRHLQ
jgi:hypothetical protein